MSLKEVVTANSKGGKTHIEQGWRQRYCDEAKQHTEDKRERCLTQVAQVMAPPRAHRTQQEKRADDAVKEYESRRSELRGTQFVYRCRNILPTGSGGMMPRRREAYNCEWDEGPPDVVNTHVYVVAVDRTKNKILWLILSDCRRRSTWCHNLQRWMWRLPVPSSLASVRCTTQKLFVSGGGFGDVVLV